MKNRLMKWILLIFQIKLCLGIYETIYIYYTAIIYREAEF